MNDSILRLINGPESNLLYKYLFFGSLLLNIVAYPILIKLCNKINKMYDLLIEIKYKS
jgi:hypothetical protein